MPRQADKDKPRHYIQPGVSVQTVTLGDLISGVRSVVPEQQERLGFDSLGLEMPLWIAGDKNLARHPCVAIVGTRSPSAEGKARARRLARELTRAGVVVVSGLAKGVDTEALTAAIDAGGHVIAVIGTPIDVAYPAENKRLQEDIYRDHLLISQFPIGRRVFPSNFPERNRLMAAISDASAIVEAGETSGTLHQASECVRLERFLFVAQSVVNNPKLEWPRKFASSPTFRVLTNTDDILKEIGSPQ